MENAPRKKPLRPGGTLVILRSPVPVDEFRTAKIIEGNEAARGALGDLLMLQRGTTELGSHFIPNPKEASVILYDVEDIAIVESLRATSKLILNVLPMPGVTTPPIDEETDDEDR